MNRMKPSILIFSQARRFDRNDPRATPSVTALTYSHKYTLPAMPPISDKTYDLAISFLTPHYFARARAKAKRYAAWIHTDYTALSFDRAAELAMWEGYDAICGVSEQVTRGFQTVFPELADKVQTVENILPQALRRAPAALPQTHLPPLLRGKKLRQRAGYLPPSGGGQP